MPSEHSRTGELDRWLYQRRELRSNASVNVALITKLSLWSRILALGVVIPRSRIECAQAVGTTVESRCWTRTWTDFEERDRSRRVIGKGGGSRTWRLRAFRQRRGLDVRRSTVVSAAPEPKAKNERRGVVVPLRRRGETQDQPRNRHVPTNMNDMTLHVEGLPRPRPRCAWCPRCWSS